MSAKLLVSVAVAATALSGAVALTAASGAPSNPTQEELDTTARADGYKDSMDWIAACLTRHGFKARYEEDSGTLIFDSNADGSDDLLPCAKELGAKAKG